MGANPDAARYAGMRPRFLIVLTMTLCGPARRARRRRSRSWASRATCPPSYATNVGFDAIAVALLGRSHPVGILFAALLFGAMRAGSGLMQIQAGIPVQMVDVLTGTILFFLAIDVLIRRWFRIRVGGGLGHAASWRRSPGPTAGRA